MPKILEILAIILSLIISLAIFVPLTGILVRLRANYNPKGFKLTGDTEVEPLTQPQPHTGPIIKSYFGMFRRVYALEGLNGLYKGLMPTLLSTAVVSLFIVLFIDTSSPRHSRYQAPSTGVLGTLVFSLGAMLVGLPTSILTYRAITTPIKLGYFDLMKSLRTLLTPTERSKPWILYLTPGLLLTETLHICLVTLVLSPLRRWLLPSLTAEGKLPDVSAVALTFYFVLLVFFTIILTPLEVIGTRLAIQRNHASAEYNSVSQEIDGDADQLPEYSAAQEDVIGLRHEGDSYTGMMDCAKRIVDEEGYPALFRAAWVTFLGVLMSTVGA